MKRIILLMLFVATLSNTFARDYFVGGSGASDNNPGTATQPFATIQKAASVAVAGDIIKIRAGTYRETVIPANSGTSGGRITFQPDQGAKVVISGLNEAGNTGWTVHNGSIYKKSVTLGVDGFVQHFSGNTTLAANQVFKDGIMQIEARWPKISSVDDQLNRSKIRQRNSTSNWNANSITDSGIPNIAGGWGGGKIWMTGWFIAQTRVISSSSGTTINFPGTNGDMRFSQYYYLTGKLGALTQAKEWHYENGTLYFWQEGGGAPTGVEYKVRNWAFDLRGKSNITIQGLQFFGCELNSDVNSANTILDGIKASYTNQTFLQGGGTLYTNALQTGMKVIGTGSVIRNSELRYGASQALWLGENCRAENNLITDFNWEGNYAAGISCWGNTGRQVMTRNTIARVGRSALDFGTTLLGKHTNMDIGYNDMYDCLMLSSDGGTIYASIGNDLTGSRFHHNWIHDSKAERTPSVGFTVGICAGMYLDQAAGPVTFDHNVLWNNYECDFHTWQDDRKHRNAGKSWIYNNTFATNSTDGWYSNKGYLTIVDWFFDEMRNNIFRDMISINWIPPTATYGDVKYCLQENQDPMFMGTGRGGLAYRVKAGSPAINKGIAIPGYTDGSVGVPDIGAYEVGGTEWVPGYVPQVAAQPGNTPPVVSITAPANNAPVTQGAAVTITANASDANGSITKVEFFNGTTKLGEDLTSPYSFVWNNVPVGTHGLTARATDSDNAVTTSTTVNIVVSATIAPTVSITGPSNNSQSTSGAPITIAATAADANGSVTKVEFFNGATKVGEDLTSPYSFIWNNAPIGTHVLTAKATDNNNNVTTSASVTITVSANAGPTVSITAPANNAQFMTGTPITITVTAADANGTVSKVEFFDGTTKLGEDLTSPYSFAWTNASLGSHTLTAKATDNQASVTTSAPRNITVTSNNIPTVLITGPSNNGQFDAGAPIVITATASDANGTVTKVEFFNGTTKLGEDLTFPYSFIWSDAPAGNHSINAKATDNLNAASTSPAIIISVVGPTPTPITPITPIAPVAPVANAGEDFSVIMPDHSAFLTATGIPEGAVVEYNWTLVQGPSSPIFNPSLEEIELTNLIEGVYIFELTVTDSNGVSTNDQVTIIVENLSVADGTIPRKFSPNGDGTDDLWVWPTNELYENSLLTVFNRSGQKVYEAVSYNSTWDGTMEGQPLQEGDYYYVLQLQNSTQIKAAIQIIRNN